MISTKLDRIVLDAAVAGILDDDDDLWSDLIADAEAHSEWELATAQRAAIDAVALAVIAHPVLARWSEGLRRAVKLTWTAPVAVHGRLGATLASQESATAKAGEVAVVAAELGDRIVVSAVENTKWLWRDARGNVGELSRLRWQLDVGDAPVLLLAVPSDQAATDVDSAVASGLVVAAVLLVEKAPPT